jgi:hypothetical protein
LFYISVFGGTYGAGDDVLSGLGDGGTDDDRSGDEVTHFGKWFLVLRYGFGMRVTSNIV